MNRKTTPQPVRGKKHLFLMIFFLFHVFSFPQHSLAYRYLDKDDGHDFVIVGVGVFRQNMTHVKGDDIGFEESDEGLPEIWSNRTRASIYGEGRVWHDYTFELDFQYNQEYDTEDDLTFFLKVEKDDDYLILGDHRDGNFEDTVFTAMNRKMRGVTIHGEKDNVAGTIMGGVLKGESTTDLIPADGTSGPYRTENAPIVDGSERVEIQIRDRNDPDRILQSEVQNRGRDYFIDYDDGEITFARSVDASDFRGNPVYIMVTYQYESADGLYNRSIWGARATLTPTDWMKGGATFLAEGPWHANASGIWDNRRQITGADLTVELTDRYRAGIEIARSETPVLEDPNQADAVKFGIDANPVDPLRIYGRYWKAEPEFLTFGNTDLASGTVLEEVETGEPFEFNSAALTFDIDPNIDANHGTGEESSGISATYESGDFNYISAGFRETREDTFDTNSDTTRDYFASFKHIQPEKTDTLLGVEKIDKFDDRSIKTLDSESTRFIGAIVHPMGETWKLGDLTASGAYQLEDYDNHVDETQSAYTHDIVGRVESLYRKEILIYFEQAEQFVYDKYEDRWDERTDISMLGIDGPIHPKIDAELKAKLRRLTDLVDNKTDEIEQVYTVNLDATPHVRLKTGFKAEYRNLQYPSLSPKRTEERMIVGGRIKWDIRSDLFAKAKYEYEVEDISDGETYNRDDLMLRLDYRWKNRYNLFGYYRIERDEYDESLLEPSKSTLTTILIGTKYKISSKYDLTAAYKIRDLDADIDDRREKYFIEGGYWFTRYLKFVLGYEHIEYTREDTDEADYKADVGYVSLIVKL